MLTVPLRGKSTRAFKRKEVSSPPSGEIKPRRDKKSPSYPQEFVYNLVIFIPEGNIDNEKRLYEAEANGLANNNASATTRP